ncbi:MAG: S9 family peptidase [Niabella sp.]
MHRILSVVLMLCSIAAIGQKEITLEDIYKKGTFRGETIRASFGEKPTPTITGKELAEKTGQSIGEPDEVVTQDNTPWAIVKTGRESVYRRSAKSYIHLYNAKTGELIKLNDEKVLHPSFSPDGSKLAYVMSNNLYVYDIAAKQTKAITTDGKWNFVINGNCDWVYEEEFGFSQAYQWSPEGAYIAYYRFDESRVKEYSFTVFDNAHNSQYTYKYPKAGDDNSTVEIHIYNVANSSDVKAQYEQGDIYIPRIKWAAQDNQLVVFWMNRHQNHLKLLLTNPADGSAKILYEETNKYYVDINDDWRFLKDGSGFLFTSEMNGYVQLYFYSMDGKKKTLLTKGAYDIANINGVDEQGKLVYYTLAYPTPMDRHVFATDFITGKTWQLTTGDGWHNVVFSPDYKKFYDYYSTINTPQTTSLYNITKSKKDIAATLEKKLGDNAQLKQVIKDYGFGMAEFVRMPNGKGDTLNGWMLRPAGFDASKKYPVLFCNYGGPGSQQVTNRFGAVSPWHQMLARKGFIVVSFDNTGTGYRGEAFKKKTYLQLGKYEIEDQIAAAKNLAALPYVDKNNIGHWGWSFGGFMSSLAITKGADVFTAAIAVAPVTNWRFYDNIYTERYMRTPDENPDGYDQNSPIHFTDKIKGKYLIVHGTADDNVHFQNATQMVTALVKSNVPFESAYYPNKNHGISGVADNTTIHLWTMMTKWLFDNLGNGQTKK